MQLQGIKEKIDQMKYIKSQQKIRMVTSNSGLTIGIICLILIVMLFVVICLFIRTARNNEEGAVNIGDMNNTLTESLLAECRKRKRERLSRRTERQIETEETTPLEEDVNVGAVVRHDRRFHSSPNSPVPLPRERSDTEISTLSIPRVSTLPRVSIITPDSCIYEARPDSQ